MEDKEKQIEEILEKVGVRYGMDVGGISYIVNAHKLASYLQPKLPEDSVVLSREEYRCLKSIENSYDPFWFCAFGGCEGACKECKDTCEMSIFVKERKETAKTLITKIKQALNDVETVISDNSMNTLQPNIGYNMKQVDDLLDEIEKKILDAKIDR